MLVMFWLGYMLVMFSLIMWSAKHPLMIGGLVLLSYMLGSGLISLNVSFIVGIFLFLTGVSGMMVAFLYVVALCPNPVFKGTSSSISYLYYMMSLVLIGLIIPMILVSMEYSLSYGLEMGSIGEEGEWLRDPCMFGGLANLMPLLGAVLFLCMVSVVSLCVQQKQCLGGQGVSSVDSNTKMSIKRLYN